MICLYIFSKWKIELFETFSVIIHPSVSRREMDGSEKAILS